jgi:hypothetical protein
VSAACPSGRLHPGQRVTYQGPRTVTGPQPGMVGIVSDVAQPETKPTAHEAIIEFPELGPSCSSRRRYIRIDQLEY